MSNKLGVDSVSLIKLLKDYGYCITEGSNTGTNECFQVLNLFQTYRNV